MVAGVLRWLCIVIAGTLLGGGIVLHGQVAMARYLRHEVESTFVLWRAIGKATFAFQGGETRLALAMAEVPEAALQVSDRAGWVLIALGTMLALVGPLLGGGRQPEQKTAGRAPRR